MKDWTIVIPAYNEEKRIGGTLNSLRNVFGEDLNIIVVSNGSTDGTVKLLEDLKKKNKNFEYYVFNEKLGKGGALVEGFKKTKSKYVGFIDADESFDLKFLKRVMTNFDKDIIIASKWDGVNFSKVTEPTGRKIMSRCWNLLVRIFFGLDIKDTQAGAKFFKTECFEKIDSDFTCTGFAFDVELLYKFKKAGFSIYEMYMPSKHMEGSTFKFSYVMNMFNQLMKFYFKK